MQNEIFKNNSVKPLSERASIENVFMSRFEALREPKANAGLALNVEVGSNATIVTENNRKIILCEMIFKLTGKDQNDTKSTGTPLLLSANFVVTFGIDNADGITQEQLKQFSQETAAFNAWPYWREFVQSSTQRMGLPPLILPTFRAAGPATK